MTIRITSITRWQHNVAVHASPSKMLLPSKEQINSLESSSRSHSNRCPLNLCSLCSQCSQCSRRRMLICRWRWSSEGVKAVARQHHQPCLDCQLLKKNFHHLLHQRLKPLPFQRWCWASSVKTHPLFQKRMCSNPAQSLKVQTLAQLNQTLSAHLPTESPWCLKAAPIPTMDFQSCSKMF